jgi:ATP-dependent Lon protease
MIIAKDYLLPKIREQVGFNDELTISDEAIDYIITTPALTMKEDGVRNLKRCLEVVHTKLNLFRLINPENNSNLLDTKIDVQFPFTVLKEHIDSIIKKNDSINPSLFGLYV